MSQPPWDSPLVATTGIKPMPMVPMAGEFLIQTNLKGRYLTAVGGGGQATDVIHTDAGTPRAWEKFKLWVDQTKQYYAIQTVNGNFLTANNDGGLITNTIQVLRQQSTAGRSSS